MIKRLVKWALKDELKSLKIDADWAEREIRGIRDGFWDRILSVSENFDSRLKLDFQANKNNTGFLVESVDVKEVLKSILNYLESQGAEINVKPQSNKCIEIKKKGKK